MHEENELTFDADVEHKRKSVIGRVPRVVRGSSGGGKVPLPQWKLAFFALLPLATSTHSAAFFFILIPLAVTGSTPSVSSQTEQSSFVLSDGIVVGLLNSLIAATYVIVFPIALEISDRNSVSWGKRKPVILVGTLLSCSITLLLCFFGLQRTYWMWVMSTIEFMGLALSNAAWLAEVSDIVKKEQVPSLCSWEDAFTYVGWAIGGGAVGVLMAYINVVWIFAGLTCIMVLCSGATLCFDEPAMVDYPPPFSVTSFFGSIFEPMKLHDIKMLYLAKGLQETGISMFKGFILLFFLQNFNSDAMVECGISVALFSVMFVAGWLACRLFSMFFGCKKIAMISNVLQASSIAAAFPLATLLPQGFGMVLWSAFGFTAAVSTTGLDKLTKEIIPSAWFYPRDEYLLSGVSPLLTSLKVAPFVGLLIDFVPSRFGFTVAESLCALAAILSSVVLIGIPYGNRVQRRESRVIEDSEIWGI